jgi:hypothetical protein
VLGFMTTVHLRVTCTREDDRPIRPDGLWRTAVRRRVVPLGQTVMAHEQDRIDALAREVQRHGMFGCRRAKTTKQKD